MLTAIFQNRFGFVVASFTVAAVMALLAHRAAKRFGGRPYACAALAATLSIEVAVTLFLGTGGSNARNCVINHSVFEPFRTQQGLLNLAMFVPIGYFGYLAFRAVVPVIAGAAGLSLLTEIAQAVVPGVGRGCDTSDFQMNSLGGIAGVVIAWGLVKFPRANLFPPTWRRTTALGSAGTLVVAAVIGGLLITPVHLDSTSLQFATRDEEKAAQDALNRAFGNHYKVKGVQVQEAWENSPGSLLIELQDDMGNATLSWPDARELTASFENSDKITKASFPVQGVTKKPVNKEDAKTIAETYAQRYFPAAIRGSTNFVDPVGPKGELGWMVSWRRKNADGVLMPLRLDVQVNTAGRISQLLTANPEDPKDLPPAVVKKKQAEVTAQRTMDAAMKESKLRTDASSLMAVHRSGNWRAQWLVTFKAPDGIRTETVVYVDAETGEAEIR